MKFDFGKSLKFIKETQKKNGEFLSLSSPSIKKFNCNKIYNSTFPTSLIILCLNDLNTPISKIIIFKGTKFLLTQKSDFWSFNYWTRNSKESKQYPYPDDLDDTFCSLSALFLNRPEIFKGEILAKIVNLLTFTEEKTGGPYRTWLVPSDTPEKIWLDVDLAVNSNIAYFLSLQDISLPKLDRFINRKIEKKEYITPYYPTPYTSIYFLSRFYKGRRTKEIKEYLLKQKNKDGNWGNPLNTALAISALLNLGESPKKISKAIDYLCKNNLNGQWKACAFCIDPSINKKTYYAGSPALTTAFCLEAINKYQKSIKKSKNPNQKKFGTGGAKLSKIEKEIYNKVIKKTIKIFSSLDEDLKKQASQTLKQTLKTKNSLEIILLPHLFNQSLGDSIPMSENLIDLGVANLLGWIAYTIYDDFLDEEGDPKKLSLANVCLRELTLIFRNILPYETGFFDFSKTILNRIDSANTWETTHCRGIDLKQIPNYENYQRLADRSLGHALGPIAILFSLGYKKDSLEIKNTIKFFENYIIAKQINDDAHDWEDDLKKEHISSACALVLKEWSKKNNKNPNLEEDLDKLRSIFWYKIINKSCKDVLKHSQIAMESIKKVKIINNFKMFENILAKQEKSAQDALKEQKETLQFIENLN
ncbi:terpene cyclase/mutase family protein [Patescibacteria group bacterium]|nr:terpene cyclase/mutase family protein [Patescibacteria group bacterium]